MIYINNYRNLNALVAQDPELTDVLDSLIGKTITVYSQSGGASGCGFTGILLEMNEEYIRLMTSTPSPPCRNQRCQRRKYCFRPGVSTAVKIDRIVAVLYNN